MFLPILALTLLLDQGSIATHGDVTIAPDKSSGEAVVRVENRTSRRVTLDLSAISWQTDSKTANDAFVSTDPKKLALAPHSSAPVKIQISGAEFFGTEFLNLLEGKSPVRVAVHRGLIPSQAERVELRLGQSAAFYLTNPGTSTITGRWLLRGPSGDVCADPDCSRMDSWFPFQVGPRRTARVSFWPRTWWFNGRQPQTSVVLNYSSSVDGIEQAASLPIGLIPPDWPTRNSIWWSSFLSWLEPGFRLFRTFLLLGAGAFAFWIANVLLANLQQYSVILRRLNELRGRAESISGATASRTRASLRKTCESMAETARGKIYSQDGQQQVSRGLDAFERRIELAEKLDAAYIKRNELYDAGTWPLTVANGLNTALADVEGFVNGDVSAEDLARADKMLTAALAMEAQIKELAGGFRVRLLRVQTSFARPLWSDTLNRYGVNFPSAAALLPIKMSDPEQAKILDSDPVERDLDLTQLEILSDIVSANILADSDDIVELARHRSAPKLQLARSLLKQCQEGIREDEIRDAIRKKQWYAYCEPETVKLGSAVRLWIRFSRESLNRCAARDSFSCYWNLADGTFEEGWEAFLTASSLGGFEVRPSFLHAASNPPEEITKITEPGTDREVEMQSLTPKVTWPKSSVEWKYDMIQLATSVLVPLVTVAMIEFQNETALGALPLITVGFTSQLIQSRLLKKDTAIAA